MLAEQKEREVSELGGASSRVLPYLAKEFPGELFGNWLTRLMALNALPFFKPFGKALKVTANVKSPVADPLNGPAYLYELAPHLLRTPEQLLNEFTTFSYWAAFAPSDANAGVAGRLSPPLLRICPACVRDDLRTGMPYFRKEHQLRSRACAKHGVRLLDRCPGCERPVCSATERTLLRPRCKCGSNLADERHEKIMGEVWQRLAVLSTKALGAKRAELELEHLQKVTADIVKEKTALSVGRAVREILERAFGDEGVEWLLRRPGDLLTDERRMRHFTAQQLRPHVCLALLAACNVTFEDATKAVSAIKRSAAALNSTKAGSKPKWNAFADISLVDAKTICLEFERSGQAFSKFRHYRSRAFWMLLIREREWLLARAWPPGRWPGISLVVPPIPSIEDDRQIIMRARGSVRPQVRQEATSRANCRDREWLDTLVRQRSRPVDQLSAVLKALEKAKAMHIGRAEQPTKWTVMAAATAIGVPPKTLLAQARLYREIRVLVPETSEAFALRKMNWCIRQCKERGLEVTIARIWREILGRRTGGPTTEEADAFSLLTATA